MNIVVAAFLAFFAHLGLTMLALKFARLSVLIIYVLFELALLMVVSKLTGYW